MNVVRQGLGAGGFDGVEAIGEHGAEDLDDLPITAGLSFQLALHTAQGPWRPRGSRRSAPGLRARTGM